MKKLFNFTGVLVSSMAASMLFIGYTLHNAAFTVQHDVLSYALPVGNPGLVLLGIYTTAIFLFLTLKVLSIENRKTNRSPKKEDQINHISAELNTCSGANCYQ
ncbi:MAG: hypothetical protein KJ737_05830 [Proteobacteria bacterium]|nr:hypothetical protein [Pseudomonadota bacterium]